MSVKTSSKMNGQVVSEETHYFLKYLSSWTETYSKTQCHVLYGKRIGVTAEANRINLEVVLTLDSVLQTHVWSQRYFRLMNGGILSHHSEGWGSWRF